MAEPIVFIDTSEVLEGKLEDVKTAMKELADFVEANEPRTISYDVYFSEDGAHVTVIQIHPDSASMDFHMKVAAHLFPGFADLLRMQAMDIYGAPSDALRAQMRTKAEMLGARGVRVHERHAGSIASRERSG
jgi:quinol monooxygenase YgiN